MKPRPINPADLKAGDRIRFTREGTVEARYGTILHVTTDGIDGRRRTVLSHKVPTEYVLLERARPAEPSEGSVVVWRLPNATFEAHRTIAWKRWDSRWRCAGAELEMLTWDELCDRYGHLESTVVTP